jgi:hypothetical protein
VAAGNEGSVVVVAGAGVSGTTIMRLHADGELDALFGRAGSTQIDIRSTYGSASAVHGCSWVRTAVSSQRAVTASPTPRLSQDCSGAGGGKSPVFSVSRAILDTNGGKVPASGR